MNRRALIEAGGMGAWGLAVAAALCAGGCGDDSPGVPPICEAGSTPATSFRLFAVGHKTAIEEAISVEAYEDSIRATVERDVVPHLASDRPNILVFPESVSFPTFFLGERGAAARTEDSTGGAFSALFDPYQEVFRYYADLDRNVPLQRLLVLATTDVVWRATHQTFSRLARDLGVYVVVGADVADAEVVDDPELAELLGDPERPDGADVYWAPELKVYNQALYYDPDGALVAKVRKEYLTDMEVDGLALNGGTPERLGPVSVGGLVQTTSLISRDAWMHPAVDRMALAGAQAVLQLEAFAGGWAFGGDGTYLWHPDNLKRSGWSDVQKYPELRVAVAPMLVGNYFELVFDGQSFAVVDGTPDDPERALLAQVPDTGWAAIAPWVVDEPTSGTLEEKQAAMRDVGQALLRGGAMANQYVAGTVWVDVDLPADDGYPVVSVTGGAAGAVFGASRPIAPTTAGRQRHADALVTRSGALVVVWEDTRLCAGQIFAAISLDRGATFSDPVRVAPWDRPQRTPSLVENLDGSLLVAWQEVLSPGRAQIRVARSHDGGTTWLPAHVVDRDASVESWRPALAVDRQSGLVHLAFVDVRGDDANWRVYYTRSRNSGASFETARRIDPRERGFESDDRTVTDEWYPSVAAHAGRVVLSYSHRQRPDPDEQLSFDIGVLVSDDGGGSFAAPVGLDPAGFPERLAADVAVDLRPGGDWIALWTSMRGARPDTDIAAAGAQSAFTTAPDVSPGRFQWFPALAPVDGGWVVAWQDFRAGSADIYLSRLDAGTGRFGPAFRVDDGGASAAQSWRPAVASDGDGRVYVIWEDSRSGTAQLRIAAGALPR